MKKYKIKHKISTQKLELSFSGYLVLENMMNIKNEVIKLLSNINELNINFDDIEEIDMAFFQFLFSIEKEESLKVNINYHHLKKIEKYNSYFENLKE